MTINSVLLEMVAAQAASSGNPVIAEVLAKIRPSKASETSLIDLPPSRDERSPGSQDPGEFDRMAAALNDLQEHVKHLTSELDIVRGKCDLLASALGACCLCWGEDPTCRMCRGKGRPGFTRPDEALLREFVLPAIKMLKAQRLRTHVSSAPRLALADA